MDKTAYIELIEPTPTLHTPKCKIKAFMLRLFLQLTTPTVGLVSWWLYDYFIAGACVLLSFIIMGIVRSKLRNSVIPLTQQEYHYNDSGIANWYTAKKLCFGDDNEKK
jgi:hypothetical protein